MIAIVLAAIALTAPPDDPLPGVKRVLILGDSITASGLYTAYLEGYFTTRYPERRLEFINLGLPSETISGLSEPSHPWPRPNVHERLERAMTLKPDVVFACYGMNDGIYHPFSERRFAAFQEGVQKLIVRCRKDSIPLYLLTPPPFDPLPVRKILKPADAQDFGWQTPYERYQEDVISRYATWEKTLASKGVTIVDVQSEITEYLQGERRMLQRPDTRLAEDGVHLNADGQWLITVAILRALHCPIDRDDMVIDAKSLRSSRDDVKNVRRESGGIRFTWTAKLPVPDDPDWSEPMRQSGSLSEQQFRISGLEPGRYVLYEGNQSVGELVVDGGSVKFDTRKYPQLSSNRRAAEIGKLIREKERIMSLAWLDYVGHKRPDTAKGLPLDKAQKQAEPIAAEIRRLLAPQPLELRVVGQ